MVELSLGHAMRAAAPSPSGALQRSMGLQSVLSAVIPRTRSTRTIGRYEIEALLGTGSMGSVYRAFDPVTARRVAIKVTREVEHDGGVGRAAHEAEALRKSTHPNVVKLYEVRSAEREAYLVMEYVDGATFDTWLLLRPSCGRVLEACLQAGLAIEAAHRAGVVHCDIKPGNILVTRDGQVRLADFGISRFPGARLPKDEGGHTRRYAAPELLAGADPHVRSDIYAYCLTLLEETAHCSFHACVRPLLERGCAVNPEDRWPDMASLLVALRAATRN